MNKINITVLNNSRYDWHEKNHLIRAVGEKQHSGARPCRYSAGIRQRGRDEPVQRRKGVFWRRSPFQGQFLHSERQLRGLGLCSGTRSRADCSCEP